MLIKIVRHGLSGGNTGEENPLEVGDHNLSLTRTGRKQARGAGTTIGADFIRDAIAYKSPYKRTRLTFAGILEGAGLTEADLKWIYEDPRLREIDHGYNTIDWQEALRKVHGWFYYRFKGGESPADGFDRICTFLESMMRQIKRKKAKKVLIVTHGLIMRCFVMRFMHLTVEQFESLANPHNCDIITIGLKKDMENPQFTSGKWGITGLRFREKATSKKAAETVAKKTAKKTASRKRITSSTSRKTR